MKSWFAIDFISSLPLDYVFLGLEGQSYSAGRALRILRLAKLLQLLRLLRISRLVRYVRLWQEVSMLPQVHTWNMHFSHPIVYNRRINKTFKSFKVIQIAEVASVTRIWSTRYKLVRILGNIQCQQESSMSMI